MKKILLILFACTAISHGQVTGTIPISHLPSMSTLTGSEKLLGVQAGTTGTVTTSTLKTYILNGLSTSATSGAYSDLTGRPSFSTGLTLTGSLVTVSYGTTSGTALQGSALGTTVQGYSANLTTLGGTTNPFTAGSGVTMTGTWPNITLSAPTSSYSFGTGLLNSGGVITVVYGTTANTALQGNSIGTSVQGYNVNLQSISNGTWTGTTTITTVGTVGSGTWQGTPVAVAYGGTGTNAPALVAGTNISITGSWPNQTINATSSTGTTILLGNGSGGFTPATISGLTLSGTNIAVTYPLTSAPGSAAYTASSAYDAAGSTKAWSLITGTPTTLSGYGITNGQTAVTFGTGLTQTGTNVMTAALTGSVTSSGTATAFANGTSGAGSVVLSQGGVLTDPANSPFFFLGDSYTEQYPYFACIPFGPSVPYPTFTGTTTLGGTTVTGITGTINSILSGNGAMFITGPGIPAGTTISVTVTSSGTLALSGTATISGSGTFTVSGNGMGYVQWFSSLPEHANSPCFAYGILGQTALGVTALVTGTGPFYGTEFINGQPVGAIGSISTAPTTVRAGFTGPAGWVIEAGINNAHGGLSITGTDTAALAAACTTIKSLSGSNTIVVPMLNPDNNPATSNNTGLQYQWNRALLQMVNGTTSGFDNFAPVDTQLNDSSLTNLYYDGLHLTSQGYRTYAGLLSDAFKSSRKAAAITPSRFLEGPILIGNYSSGTNIGGSLNLCAGNGTSGSILTIYDNGSGTTSGINSTGSGNINVVGSNWYLKEGTMSSNSTDLFGGNGGKVYVNRNDLVLLSAGTTIEWQSGRTCNTKTLVSGTVVVSDTSLAAGDEISVWCDTPSANAGALYISARTNGTGYTISSTNAADTSIVVPIVIHRN